ncbi:hypothetical protein ACFMPD_07435 [Sedimentitalea sp. HM32M-2]|uniref:hypothetical protein n=1 Tax=Sedimentitalea sp. HM32M-2 TaxID=3351566 RepID=UPI0036341DD4
MTKQEQFLWGIQTLVLLDAQNFSLDNEHAMKNRHEISATGRFTELMVAIKASEQIPDDVPVQDAIHDFYYWLCYRYGDMSDHPAQPTWLRDVQWEHR